MQFTMRRPTRRNAACAWLVIAVATIGAMPTLRAQSPTPLSAVYEAVQQGNPRIAAGAANARAASARVAGARRPPDPKVQVGLMNYTLPGLAPMDPLGMRQLQVMQMVPLGGKLRLAGDAAQARADAAGMRAAEVAWEMRARAAMAFHDLHAIDARLDLARETLRLLGDIGRTAESMYRLGGGRQADVLRAQVEIARMAADTTRMRAMRSAMIAQLGALTDHRLPPGIIPAFPVLPDTVPELHALQVLASSTRPMLGAAAADVRAAGSIARLAHREILPDLQLGIQFGRGSATMLGRDADGTLMAERKSGSMVSLMAGASIPIFARDRQYQMRAEANAMYAMAQADLEAMQADTRARIAEVHAALVRSRDLSTLYRTSILPQARVTVTSALSAYRTGSVDFMTLLDNQMTVNRYREELASLEAEEGKAWAELEMLIGRALFAPTTVRPTSGGDT